MKNILPHIFEMHRVHIICNRKSSLYVKFRSAFSTQMKCANVSGLSSCVYMSCDAEEPIAPGLVLTSESMAWHL